MLTKNAVDIYRNYVVMRQLSIDQIHFDITAGKTTVSFQCHALNSEFKLLGFRELDWTCD